MQADQADVSLGMRLLIDTMIALMLVAAVGVGVMLHNDRKREARDIVQAQDSLQRLHEQAAYHSTMQSAMAGQDTLLVDVQPKWFGQDLPTNPLVTEAQPWLDLAPPGDRSTHPPDPVVTGKEQAGFWYNPTNGIFRARVTPQTSEAQTIALYNEVNGSALDVFEQMPDPARQPIAHVPGRTPATQYAAMTSQSWSQVGTSDQTNIDVVLEAPLSVASADATNTDPKDTDELLVFEDESAPEKNADSASQAGVETDRPTLFR